MPKYKKLKGGLDQYGAECFGILIFATVRKSVGLNGLIINYASVNVRVRTIPSLAVSTQYPILWRLTIPIPSTNTDTGSDVICCTDWLQITNKILLKINI